MAEELERWQRDRLPSQVQAERAVEKARQAALGLSPDPDGASTHLHVHHHYAAPAAPEEKEKGVLETYGPWLLIGFAGLPLVAGIVVLLIFVFGVVVAGFQAMAGALMGIGIVVALVVAAAKAPAKKGK